MDVLNRLSLRLQEQTRIALPVRQGSPDTPTPLGESDETAEVGSMTFAEDVRFAASHPERTAEPTTMPIRPATLVSGHYASGIEVTCWTACFRGPFWICNRHSPDISFPCNSCFPSPTDLAEHHYQHHCYFRCQECCRFERNENMYDHYRRHRHRWPVLEECYCCGDRYNSGEEHTCFSDTGSPHPSDSRNEQQWRGIVDSDIVNSAQLPPLTVATGLGLSFDG